MNQAGPTVISEHRLRGGTLHLYTQSEFLPFFKLGDGGIPYGAERRQHCHLKSLKCEPELLLAMIPVSQGGSWEKKQQIQGSRGSERILTVSSVLVPVVPQGSSTWPLL